MENEERASVRAPEIAAPAVALPPRRSVWRQMFTPASYPAPKLDLLGVSWRYGAAVIYYVSMAVGLLSARWWEEQATQFEASASPDASAAASASASPGPTVTASPDGPTVGYVGPDSYTGADVAAIPPAMLAVDILLGAIGFVLIRFRRRWPFATFLVIETLTPISNCIALFAVWSFISLASRRNWRQIVIAIGYTQVVTAAAMILVPWHGSDAGLGLLGALILGTVGNVVAALIGAYYGVRQDRVAGVEDRAANADRDRELAVLGERNRIAREMHDVLAHRISLVSMHAGALAFRSDLPPEQTRDIARIIQENAHASLGELRSVLSTLRDGQLDAAGAPAAPQPTLADLPDLLAQARSLGQRISLDMDVDPATVNQVTSRHAYRILQECLTNARKHAPYSTVHLALQGSPGAGLRICSENPLGPSSRSTVPGAGLGLIGVRERVTMLGGQIEAGPVKDQFVVDARLPWPASS